VSIGLGDSAFELAHGLGGRDDLAATLPAFQLDAELAATGICIGVRSYPPDVRGLLAT
jgi:hypothetical protein